MGTIRTIKLIECVYEIRTNDKIWKIKTNADEVFCGDGKIFIADTEGGSITVKEGEDYLGKDGTFVYWFYQGENR